MFEDILSYVKRLSSKKLKLAIPNPGRIESKKPLLPTIVVEESITMEGSEHNGIFKISFEVPMPGSYSRLDKEEMENMRNSADMTFRPVAAALTHYFSGLILDESPERFIEGRNSLIMAIQQCAMTQLAVIRDTEKNR